MSDLSRSLVDAAAEAFPPDPCEPDDRETVVDWELISTTEADRAEDINLPEMYSVPIFGPVEQVARAAVAAVLETLAATAQYDEDGGFELWEPGQLRRLAAEVKEDTA